MWLGVSALVGAVTAALFGVCEDTEYAAAAAVNSVDPDRWWIGFSAVMDRIAPRFTRYEPLRHAGELMAGMVSGLDRKNCWTIAEHRGNDTPDGLQHLLARAKWNADAVRDDLRDYIVDAFGDPGAVLVVDETGDVKKGTTQRGGPASVQWHRGPHRELPDRRVPDVCRATRACPDRPRPVPAAVLD